MDVESVEDRRGERVENRRPSEVFLALWRWRSKDVTMTFEEFASLADTWAQIRELEEIAARERRREIVAELAKGWYPQWADDLRPCGGETAPEPREGQAPPLQTPTERVSESAAGSGEPEPVSESDHSPEEADEEAEAEAKKARSLQSAKGFAERKRKALARVSTFRADGGTLAAIVEASGGKLTMDVLLDLVACKPQPVVTWAALEKALNKLEPLSEAKEAEK